MSRPQRVQAASHLRRKVNILASSLSTGVLLIAHILISLQFCERHKKHTAIKSIT